MAGAFSPSGPGPRALTPQEEYERFLANAKGSAASFADPFGLTTLLGPDSIAQPLKEAQEGGSAATNLFGALSFPMGALTAAPKTVGALTGLGAYFGGADSAEAARKKKLAGKPKEVAKEETDEIKTLVDKWKDKDPSLLGFYSTYTDAKRKATGNIPGVDKASADEIRRRSSEDSSKALSELMARIEKLDPPKQTFNQRYGKLAEAWPWIQAGTGVGVGMLMGGKARLSDDMFKYGPWQRSISKFDEATNPNPGMISRFTGTGNNPSRAYKEAERIEGFANKFGNAEKGAFSGLGVPTVAGATASAEVGMLPDAYNLRYAPQDSEDYKRAEQHLSGAGEALKAYGPMVALSALGAGTGAKMIGGKDKTQALMAQSRPALERLGSGTRGERASNFRAAVQDDIDLANMGRPTPSQGPLLTAPGPTPAPGPGNTGLALPPPQSAGAPPTLATGPVPPTPPKPPRAPSPKQKDLLSEFEKGLKNLESGKPFATKGSFMRGKDPKAKERVLKGADALGLTSPNASPSDVERARKLLASGNLKLGMAGAATGYSAFLAKRLAELHGQGDDEQSY